MKIEDRSHTPCIQALVRRGVTHAGCVVAGRRSCTCRRRLTARAVGMISKQAGLS